MTPAISVIVPHLNQPEALAGLLQALAAQSFRDFEVIVADNGSRAPLPPAITDYPGLSTLRETTPGPGPARSAGAAIARAFATEPAVLFADEPTGNLDPRNSQAVLEKLISLCNQQGHTLLTVTHDHSLLPRFDRVVDFREFQ